MKDTKLLFDEFPSIETETWEKIIQNDLQGADYEKTLVWKTIENISVHPYYRKKDLPKTLYSIQRKDGHLSHEDKIENANNWYIREYINVKNAKNANKKAISTLMKGATSLYLDIADIENLIVSKPEIFHQLLYDLYPDSINLSFKTGSKSKYILKLLQTEINNKKLNKADIYGTLDFDPLGELTSTGNFYESLNKDLTLASDLLHFSLKNIPNYRILGVNGLFFTNCGANIVQELAFCLSIANEYLSLLMDRGHSINDIIHRIQFNFGISSNYFFEIAKLRAVRFLWRNIVAFYQNVDYIPMHIHSTTCQFNKSACDPHTNFLRLTTEAMSAVLGGTNSLTVEPYNASFQSVSDFSERISRNIQIVLKNEAYFNKVFDPAQGSYYIEYLTEAIAKEAWKLFKTIENKGGYIIAFMEGFIQKEIHEVSKIRKHKLNTGQDILVGINKYNKTEENLKIDIRSRSSISQGRVNKKIKLGKPLMVYGLADEFEQIRYRTGKLNKPPVVYLLSFGNIAKSKTRASFSSDFFACGGFKIINTNPSLNIKDQLKEAIQSKADIIVLCSSDEEYKKIGPTITDDIKKKCVLVIAGNPKDDIESLKKIGINHFIHIQSNIVESLNTFLNELGIE